MLKNMQEENEGTDEGAAGGSTKKAQMQESVADVYDTNIRTFSKEYNRRKTWQ